MVVHSGPRRSCFLTLRPTWMFSTFMTSRGSGDHQATLNGSSPSLPTMAITPSATLSSYRNSLMFLENSSGAGNGTIPRLYAPSRLAGLRSPQKATGLSPGADDMSSDAQSL